MLKIIRYMIAICFFIIAIMFFKNKTIKIKKRLLKFIPSIFLSLLIFIMPFENLFLKFDTPELAFNYSISNRNIIKIVPNKLSALVIYEENGHTTATLINKCDDKWKASFLPDDQIQLRLENNEIVLITKERKSNNFYVMISLKSNIKTLSDNYDSYFELYSSNQIWNSFVAYVENYENDYIINIDGKEYKIEI
ncbi:hypothetical protein [Porcipelethomonas sp.]|uniref:hypothetical protein n=1 Tax=Porcipelethomonas sp. TaxID=2981675 RepID=UPI003079E29A